MTVICVSAYGLGSYERCNDLPAAYFNVILTPGNLPAGQAGILVAVNTNRK